MAACRSLDAILLRLQRCSLIGVVTLIASGLFLFTYHYTEFDALGFSLIMTASFLSGLRWTITQLITQKHELGRSDNVIQRSCSIQ